MNLKNLLSVNAVIGLLFGIPFAVAANASMQVYGLTMCPDGLNLVRYYGVSLAFIGLLSWVLKKVEDAGVQRSISLLYSIGCFLGGVAALYNQLTVGIISLVWLTVALYLGFSLAYCYLWITLKK